MEWIANVTDWLADLPFYAVALFYFFTGIIEILFQPWPGTTLLVFGGCLSAVGLPMGWLFVCGSFWLGETLGSIAVFEIGARGGERILAYKPIRILYSKSMRKRVTHWMETYGAGMLAIAKFTAGINTAAILIAGVTRMQRTKAYTAIGLFCLAHNALFYAAGVMLGGTLDEVLALIERYNRMALWVGIPLVALVAAFFIVKLIWERRTKKSQKEDC